MGNIGGDEVGLVCGLVGGCGHWCGMVALGEGVGGTASLKLGTHCLTRYLYISFLFFLFFCWGGGGGGWVSLTSFWMPPLCQG